MMNERDNSIFRTYYTRQPFVDLFLEQPEKGIDVIIPVIHTNELWEENLLSFYREIPIHSLLIGDGGCIDDSIEIVKRFPRVIVLDHKNFISLGYSICKLIEAVETEWFVYLHSDVYLPEGWFEMMLPYQKKYDFYECRQQATLLVEYPIDYTNYHRALSGAQMGKVDAFQNILPIIDDDFLYRTEDIILSKLVMELGYKYGHIDNAFHYHQTMRKPTPWSRKVKEVEIYLELSRGEEVRTWSMHAKGIIKYLQPSDPWLIDVVTGSIINLQELGEFDRNEFERWIKETNPVWLPYIKKGLLKMRLKKYISQIMRTFNRLFKFI
jgi:hypothetical protein